MANFNFNINGSVNVNIFVDDYEDIPTIGEFTDSEELTADDIFTRNLIEYIDRKIHTDENFSARFFAEVKGVKKCSHRKKNIGRDKSFDERSDKERHEEDEE
jgi:hypothetical protein